MESYSLYQSIYQKLIGCDLIPNYVAIIFPIVALQISSLLPNYHLTHGITQFARQMIISVFWFNDACFYTDKLKQTMA